MRSGTPTKERERYYLLPGMGGRAQRQKVRRMIFWGLLAGAMTSLLVATMLYVLNRLGEGVI